MPAEIVQRRPIDRLTRPLREFVQTESRAGLVLLAAILVALGLANSPWRDGFESLWEAELSLTLGRFHLSNDVRHWVNEGLMTLFFFVVGLEIKRELVTGELRDPRKAALPALAALGGMIVPALLYAALNAGGPGSAGWGIPMATDIAFALGVLTILGSRAPAGLKVFLVSLAILDDVGAILVIAGFYSHGISWPALGSAVAFLAGIAVLRGLGVRWVPAYVVGGAAVWFATLESGVHATIAGVVLALMTPTRPLGDDDPRRRLPEDHQHKSGSHSVAEARRAAVAGQEMVSPAERLEDKLHPWASFFIIPVFALANAGIAFGAGTVQAAVGSSVGLGIVLGLVVGKPVGILAFCALGVRAQLASLPQDVRWHHLAGVAALAGIGFTVSLFVAGLAFGDGELTGNSKVAILLASFVAALVGTAVLVFTARRQAT
jgi:NhaA family Na+:H+ antiporter